MSQQLYLNEEGVKIILSLLVGKMNDMKHLSYEVVLAENDDATIQQTVTSPAANTVYLFKAGAATTYKMYLCDVTKDSSGGSAVNWLPVGEGSVDLSDYYSKEELKPISTERIQQIFEEVIAETSVSTVQANAEVTE